MSIARETAVAALFGTLLLGAPTARAESCPVPEGAPPSLANEDGARRLAYLDAALRRAEDHANTWGWAWRTTFQTAAFVQLGLSTVTTDRANRLDLVAGGFKSTVGALFALFFPLPAERRGWSKSAVAGMPLCARLAEAEKHLVLYSAGEKRGRGIGMHVLGLTFNLAVGIGVGILHRRWSTAITGMAIGAAVGSARIFTQPTVASDALEVYREGAFGAAQTAKVSVAPTFVPVPGGAELGLAFAW